MDRNYTSRSAWLVRRVSALDLAKGKGLNQSLRRVLPLFLFIISCTVLAQQVELTQFYPTPDGYSVYLPSGWDVMPKEIVDEMNLNMRSLSSAFQQTSYKHVFQGGNSEFYGDYPVITISDFRGGKIVEDTVDEFIDGVRQGIQTARSEVPDLTSEWIGQIRYDEERKIIYSSSSMRVGDDYIVGLTGYILTEFGVVQVIGQCLEPESETYIPVFEAVINGVRIDADSVYRTSEVEDRPAMSSSNVLDTLTGEKLFRWFLIAVSMVIATAIRHRRRKKFAR